MSPSSPILVIGASGKTGSRVTQRLNILGLATRAVTRTTPISFDWARPESWRAALHGASMAYVTYHPDLATPGASTAIAELADLARREGLEQMVLLSGRGEPGAERAEQALQRSGVGWACVRASWFNQNFSEGFLYPGVMSGAVALPAGSVREPFVDVEDIADVVVAALTNTKLANALYELTGPQALSFGEAAEAIASATGRTVQYIPVSQAEFASGLRAAGVAEHLADLLQELCAVVLDGRNSKIMHGVEQALGRPARHFADFARGAAAAGAWR